MFRPIALAAALALMALACGRTRTPPPHPPADASSDAADGGGDADAATECAPLGPAACLAAGCIPTYDDTCCPACTPIGACADCTNPDFFICRTMEDACTGSFCSVPAAGTCDAPSVDCTSTMPFDEDSCSLPGCVPVVAAVGDPELPPTCVAISAESCTVSCRSLPPECPDGTTAEGDGSCWTGQCIPASVCS